MKYYIIAGEASGDLHGSNLIASLQQRDPQAVIRAWGGDLMQKAGAHIVKHYRDLAFMGFVEVLQHLGTILKNIRFCKEDIAGFKPVVVIFIDYPGFNLRIVEWAKKQGFKTAYYISPTIWAWNEGRINTIKKYVDLMLVILPFEKEFYKKHDYSAVFVGHPLVEVIDRELTAPSTLPKVRPTVALLPGSRTQEIKKNLPLMLKMVAEFPECDFMIAQAPGQEASLYRMIMGGQPVPLINNKTYDLMKIADAALVTSGTATLECALMGVPQVVVYKSNAMTYQIAKRLVKVKYISLVNLILNKPVVAELIQNDFNEEKLRENLDVLLHDYELKDKMQVAYTKLWKVLLKDEKASDLASEAIQKLLSRN